MYNTKERLWVKVDNFKGTYVYGRLHNNPSTQGILVGDSVSMN
jgi:uncharacterized protein YegJ (DUF2314 family)